MFRRTVLASAGAMALTSAAVAADLGARPPPPVFLPPPPIFSWTGLYAGINAGYTWSNNNLVDTDASPGGCNPAFPGCAVTPNFSVASASLATFSLPAKTDGFIGGGQIGYNYQLNNSFVAGIEADIQGIAGAHASSSFDSTLTNPNFPTNSIDQSVSVSKSLDYLGTVRGRLGFLITPTLLVYGTGGLAYGQTNSSTNITQFVEDAGTALSPNPYSSFGGLSNFARRLDGRRRRRMVVRAQLEPQGRISLLRSRQHDLQPESARDFWPSRHRGPRLCFPQRLSAIHDSFQGQYCPRWLELSLQLGGADSGRRQILIESKAISFGQT
jgi:opacity protein-like surface antigen